MSRNVTAFVWGFLAVFVTLSFTPSAWADDSEVRQLKLEVDGLRKEVAQLQADLNAVREGLKLAAGLAQDSEGSLASQSKALADLKELVGKVEKEGVPAYVTSVDTGSIKQKLGVRRIKINDVTPQKSLVAPLSAMITVEANLCETNVFAAQRDAEEAELSEESLPLEGFFIVSLKYRDRNWEVFAVMQCKPNRTVVAQFPGSESSIRANEFTKRWFIAFGGDAK